MNEHEERLRALADDKGEWVLIHWDELEVFRWAVAEIDRLRLEIADSTRERPAGDDEGRRPDRPAG